MYTSYKSSKTVVTKFAWFNPRIGPKNVENISTFYYQSSNVAGSIGTKNFSDGACADFVLFRSSPIRCLFSGVEISLKCIKIPLEFIFHFFNYKIHKLLQHTQYCHSWIEKLFSESYIKYLLFIKFLNFQYGDFWRKFWIIICVKFLTEMNLLALKNILKTTILSWNLKIKKLLYIM